MVISDSWVENISLKCGILCKGLSNNFTSSESSRCYGLKRWRNVNDPLSAYEGAFVFSLAVITLCGFVYTYACLKSTEQ